MIEVNACDERAVGVEYIYGVETPAQANLEYRYVDFSIVECDHRCERAEFKIRKRRRLACRLNFCEFVAQYGVIHFPSIDAHALVIAQQMRGCITARLVSCAQQDCFEHRAARAFAVGATDRDD